MVAMDTFTHMIHPGDKIELKPEMQRFYDAVSPGMRGLATKTKVDGYGFPLVFVDWDKDHWKYAGENDGWTFQSHFNVIGHEPLPTPVEKDEGLEKVFEDYYEAIMDAANAAAESDGCIIMTVNLENGLPQFESYVGGLTPQAWQILKSIAEELDESGR